MWLSHYQISVEALSIVGGGIVTCAVLSILTDDKSVQSPVATQRRYLVCISSMGLCLLFVSL